MALALALDTALPEVTVAVRTASGEVVASDHLEGEAGVDGAALSGRPAHGRELLAAVRSCLERAGGELRDVGQVYVGIGPGGYTGLRVGVATARGIASALGLELRPVPTLTALAHGIEGELRLAVIDARRGEVFATLVRGEEELWPPFVADPCALADRVRGAGLEPRAAGDGALRYRDELAAAGAVVAPAASPEHRLQGAALFAVGDSLRPLPPIAVKPLYLRDPDARPRQ